MDFVEGTGEYHSSCCVGHSHDVEQVWLDVEYTAKEVKRMGFWSGEEEEKEKEVRTMKELQKTLRAQLDQLEDDVEVKRNEVDDANDRIVQAEKEKSIVTAELRDVEDEKFRVERALSALKQSKSAFYAGRGYRR